MFIQELLSTKFERTGRESDATAAGYNGIRICVGVELALWHAVCFRLTLKSLGGGASLGGESTFGGVDFFMIVCQRRAYVRKPANG